MKKITWTMLMLLPLLMYAQKTDNPFFSEYKTPFGVPPFDLIDTSHYLPAFEEGIRQQQAEIDAICNTQAAPDFTNTIAALDASGKLLSKVGAVFYSLNSAATNPAMQAIARKVAPLTTNHRDNLMLNEVLFLRIKKVWEQRLSAGLDALQIRVVEKYYDDFVRNGAGLNEDQKKRLREINQTLATLQLRFGENLLAETNTNFLLIVDQQKDLDGLPADVIQAAAEAAAQTGHEGSWVFTLQKPSMIPFLQYARNRQLREKLYRGYFMRGDNDNANDNKKIILEMMGLRAEKAQLLGYPNWAEFVISNNMAKSSESVYQFLNGIMAPALEAAIRDREAMQKMIDAEKGGFRLESWDWWYYAEKLRKQQYDLDETELKPYFVLGNVRDGMFYTATQLYGIRFRQLKDLPVYHPEVETFEIQDEKGQHLGILYLDYHPRPGKRVGAWCGAFRDQSYENGKRITPVITITCNFTRPVGDDPALLTWDEVSTLFHEFGHALHGLFSDGPYDRVAGNLPRDMVELPSQVMEHWASEPAVMKVYARHYKTGEVIPEALMGKLKKSLVFNQGFETVEYIAASLLDLDWHSIKEPVTTGVNEFEKQSMDKAKLIPEIIPRYRTTYFNHIIGGYSAGYYVYLWAAVLDCDAFRAFEESGDIFNKELATAFRKYVLTEGGNGEGMNQYLKFRGKSPQPDALLEKRGLKTK